MKLSDSDINFIKENIDKMTFKEIAENLQFPHWFIKKSAYKLGLKRCTQHFWTKEDDLYLLENFSNNQNKELAKKLHVTESAVIHRGFILGLQKSSEHIKKNGYVLSQHPASIATRLKKGNISPTKGMKMEEFMSPSTIEKFKANTFKKGHKPHNTKYDGYERFDVDGYVWVRISEKNWVQKHRLVWEKHNGEIPPGINIQFKDGNRKNCSIENLYSISKEDQMKENTIHNYPPEVQTSFRLMGKINKIIKNQENEKTN